MRNDNVIRLFPEKEPVKKEVKPLAWALNLIRKYKKHQDELRRKKVDFLIEQTYFYYLTIKLANIEHDATDSRVKKAVVNYFNDIIKNYLTGKNLLLIGNPGTGKTMLMSILTENIIRNYFFDARYANCVELINEIQDTYSTSARKTTLSVLNKYRDADFLFIDDLDKINATNDSKKLIYSIINDRYERVLPTVISANSPIEVLDEQYFDEPTVSRFLEKSVEVSFTQKNKRI